MRTAACNANIYDTLLQSFRHKLTSSKTKREVVVEYRDAAVRC